jgi:hypothetical protein
MRAEISAVETDRPAAKSRNSRKFYRGSEVPYGDGTGWLGREDSNRQMQFLNLLRSLFCAMQMPCRFIHSAWHIF